MLKVIMCRGLPASGKSTWAKEMVSKHPGRYKRVNKDDMRAMLDNKHWTKGNEKFVLRIRDLTIISALLDGYSVIVDDTNFEPKHEQKLRELAENFGKTKCLCDGDCHHGKPAQFEVKDFPIDLEEAIKRDLQRPSSVGEKVIRTMYNKYIKPTEPQDPSIEPYKPAPGLYDCIIVDIDGTLADMHKDEPGRRGPYDWHRVGEDTLKEDVAGLLATFQTGADHGAGVRTILFSGRSEECRPETEQWLRLNGVSYDELHMRPLKKPGEKKDRPDNEIKLELFDQHIRGEYRVRFVLDDRDQVVRMWRALGLTCLQVAYGSF